MPDALGDAIGLAVPVALGVPALVVGSAVLLRFEHIRSISPVLVPPVALVAIGLAVPVAIGLEVPVAIAPPAVGVALFEMHSSVASGAVAAGTGVPLPSRRRVYTPGVTVVIAPAEVPVVPPEADVVGVPIPVALGLPVAIALGLPVAIALGLPVAIALGLPVAIALGLRAAADVGLPVVAPVELVVGVPVVAPPELGVLPPVVAPPVVVVPVAAPPAHAASSMLAATAGAITQRVSREPRPGVSQECLTFVIASVLALR